ncbi:MAG: proline dehydrogenase family protein [Candidatus Obscuribacterales bacterium]
MPVELPVKPANRKRSLPAQMHPRLESTASSVIDKIPVSMVLHLAKPYLAGETAEQAVALAHQLFSKDSFTSTLDILGEDMESDATCDASVEAYKQLAERIAANPLAVNEPHRQLTISLKPSMFATAAPGAQGNGHSEDVLMKAYERIKEVTAFARERGIRVTLEAEDHRWTDFHLNTYRELIESGLTNLGTVIQTRLFRTQKDLELFDQRMRVRLVIGIYNEPAAIAHTDKAEMKRLLVDYAGVLLERGVYVEIATHDIDCIHDFFERVALPGNISPDRFEFQFLHGVPRDQLQKGLVDGSYCTAQSFPDADPAVLESLRASGFTVRKYLPFGQSRVAGAYCRRRLKENPNMVSYGIKNFFGWQS